jgi:hypothetical protein
MVLLCTQVCEKCEKKLTKVACPEKWKEGTDKRKVRRAARLCRGAFV